MARVLGRRRRRTGGLLAGAARVDRRTKDLLHRLRPGEVAVIDHEDLDWVSAEGLVERGAAAVVNARASISGRYATAGPLVLARAGIPLIDCAGQDLLERVREGDVLRIDGDRVYRGDDLLATGLLVQGEVLERTLATARTAMGDELERFVRNTMEYLSRERDLLLGGVGVPELDTPVAGRQALVVVRGHEYRQDLKTLRAFVAETRPVLIAVDGAADALLDEGFRPDVIVGDMDSVSTNALASGAELVVHAYPDGRAPGLERLEGLGLPAKIFRSAGTSEDIALLLAYERGADLIVAVGAHDNLIEFLDKGRGGMASTFLVRLKVGPKLVDAKRVNRLYRTQIRRREILLLVGSALASMLVVVAVSEPVRAFFDAILEWFKDVWYDVRQVFR